jgi:hypothetical protein
MPFLLQTRHADARLSNRAWAKQRRRCHRKSRRFDPENEK